VRLEEPHLCTDATGVLMGYSAPASPASLLVSWGLASAASADASLDTKIKPDGHCGPT
jgi:hypothetical protein